MITGELKSKVDAIWNAMWTGGLSNPQTVMEQPTLLLLLKGVDDAQTRAFPCFADAGPGHPSEDPQGDQPRPRTGTGHRGPVSVHEQAAVITALDRISCLRLRRLPLRFFAAETGFSMTSCCPGSSRRGMAIIPAQRPRLARRTTIGSEVTLVITPHPELSKVQKQAIRVDYGMDAQGRIEITVQKSMLYYALRRLGLDADPAARRTQDQQIVLLNRDAVHLQDRGSAR